MTRFDAFRSGPAPCQARPKAAAIQLVVQARLQRIWYNVSGQCNDVADLPRMEIVQLELAYTVLALPRTWFEFRDAERRRIFLDRQVRLWKVGTALEFGSDAVSLPADRGPDLFFTGSGSARQLHTYPANWQDLSDEELVTLFEQAQSIS